MQEDQTNDRPLREKLQNKDKQHTAFLKNVGYKTRESDLIEFFSQENVEQIMIAKDERGQPKGFGFVTFKNKMALNTYLKIGKGSIKGKEFEILKYDKPIMQM